MWIAIPAWGLRTCLVYNDPKTHRPVGWVTSEQNKTFLAFYTPEKQASFASVQDAKAFIEKAASGVSDSRKSSLVSRLFSFFGKH